MKVNKSKRQRKTEAFIQFKKSGSTMSRYYAYKAIMPKAFEHYTEVVCTDPKGELYPKCLQRGNYID